MTTRRMCFEDSHLSFQEISLVTFRFLKFWLCFSLPYSWLWSCSQIFLLHLQVLCHNFYYFSIVSLLWWQFDNNYIGGNPPPQSIIMLVVSQYIVLLTQRETVENTVNKREYNVYLKQTETTLSLISSKNIKTIKNRVDMAHTHVNVSGGVFSFRERLQVCVWTNDWGHKNQEYLTDN